MDFQIAGDFSSHIKTFFYVVWGFPSHECFDYTGWHHLLQVRELTAGPEVSKDATLAGRCGGQKSCKNTIREIRQNRKAQHRVA